jgi:hypothetical protein
MGEMLQVTLPKMCYLVRPFLLARLISLSNFSVKNVEL